MTPSGMLLAMLKTVIDSSSNSKYKSNTYRGHRKADAGSNEKERHRMTNHNITRVIHDLRTPLTSVRSLSKILYDYPKLNGEKRREFLDIINQETKRMTGIIKQAELPVRSTSEIFTQAQSK
jgi:signal transduction histidine kinase